MALETLSGGDIKSLSALKPGETLEGFLKGVIKETNKFNGEQYNFLMQNENGSDFKVLSGGTAKYFAANVASAMGLEPVDPKHATAIETAKKSLGKWLVFTIEGEYKNSRQQTVKKYKVQMDSSKKQSEEIPF